MLFASATVIPPPGAVCPAMVRNGFLTSRLLCKTIKPATRKMQFRGPELSTHALRLPDPESFRFVTSITCPPRPPIDTAPPPCAPGNAGSGPDGVGDDDVTVTLAELDIV